MKLQHRGANANQRKTQILQTIIKIKEKTIKETQQMSHSNIIIFFHPS